MPTPEQPPVYDEAYENERVRTALENDGLMPEVDNSHNVYGHTNIKAEFMLAPGSEWIQRRLANLAVISEMRAKNERAR